MTQHCPQSRTPPVGMPSFEDTGGEGPPSLRENFFRETLRRPFAKSLQMCDLRDVRQAGRAAGSGLGTRSRAPAVRTPRLSSASYGRTVMQSEASSPGRASLQRYVPCGRLPQAAAETYGLTIQMEESV